MGRTFPGITGAVLDPATYEPIEEPGKTGTDSFQARMACHDEDILEE